MLSTQVTAQNVVTQAKRVVLLPTGVSDYVSLLAVYVIWERPTGIRFALESFPPYLLGIRFVLAGGTLFNFLRARGAQMPTLNSGAR
jgi:hypothetical protein